MADFIPVEQTDTFDQWRIKTNQLGSDFASIEADVAETIANIDLSTKADTNHSHVIANVTGLQTELDSLEAVNAAHSDRIDGKVSLTGNESIFGSKVFGNLLLAGRGLSVYNGGVDISGQGATKLTIQTGQMKLRNQDYTWPSSYTGGRYLRTDSQGNLTWEEVAGGSGSVNLSTLVFNDIVPVGTIMPWAGTSLPADGKWKFCNGENVSKNTYSELFGIISNKYGTANSGNNFKLPNLNGKVTVGAGTGFSVGTEGGKTSQDFSGNGDVTGSVTISGSTAGHKLTGDQTGVKAHSHDGLTFAGNATFGSAISRNGGYNVNTKGDPSIPGFGNQFIIGADTGVGQENASFYGANRGSNIPVGTITSSSQDADVEHSHGAGTLSGTLSGASASVTGSVNVMQPYLVTQYIIKVLPDDVQQVSIHAGNGINVQNAQGNDSDKINLFSTALNVAADAEHFKFSESGLLQLKSLVQGPRGYRGYTGSAGSSVTASYDSATRVLTITV